MTIDFVFQKIYLGAKNGGANERCAHDAATTGTDACKKNKFNGKASDLIEKKIKEAIKSSKRKKG